MRSIEATPEDVQTLGQALRKVDFFSNVSLHDLDRIMSCIRLFEVPPGRAIFRQGDPGDALYVVAEGRLRVIVKPAWYRFSREVGELQTGMFFGEMALVDGAPRSATIETATVSKIFVLLRDDFDAVAHANPEFFGNVKRIANQRKFDNRQAA
jgi:CRP-like cAMP-binding protein